jgi:DNA-binding LacI/PurR family transcriptional regulator/signal transduction histidine kinase
MNSLFDGYESTVWRSAVRASEEFDVDLLCFLGGSLGDGSRRDSLFQLIHPDLMDALVVLSASIGILTGPAEVASLVSRMKPIPTVSVSDQLAGVPSILVDNAAGISELVEHLVRAHGCRRIAYVGGPAGSSEAALRFQGYRDATERLRIAFDPALVTDGDWGAGGGIQAVRTFMDDRRVAFDALLCSNDLMAIAALHELQQRGVDVPGQIALCGFDDIPDAASTTPPITTIRQSLVELGREAVRRAAAFARGEGGEQLVVLPARIVVRQSCGCSGREDRRPVPAAGEEAGAPELSLSARLEAAFPGLGNRLGFPNWAAELGAALGSTGAAGEQAFLLALRRLLERGLQELPDPAEWFAVLREALSLARADFFESTRGVSLSESAHTLVATMAAAAQFARRARADEEARVLHRMIQPFPLPQAQFIRNLLSALEELGVRSFFLCKYQAADLGLASLVAHRDPDGFAELEGIDANFPAHRLIPGAFSGRHRSVHAVLPIQSPDGPIGFAVCEIGPLVASAYEMLMHQISIVSSMNGLMAKLQDQQRTLLDAARQAGMAEVAVGTLHNVGNLLTTVNICAEQIASYTGSSGVDGLRRAVELMAAHRDDLPGFFGRDPRAQVLMEYLDRVSQQLAQDRSRLDQEARQLLKRVDLVRETTHSLQEVARGGHSALLRERLDLAGIAETVLETQAPFLSRYQVVVQTQLDAALPPVTTERAKLIHLLVNLVKNAVEAMRSKAVGERVLSLGIATLGGDRVRITVGDSGEGIAPESLDKIFTMGFTTKADGHGFGLHSCALYAKQLGGCLTVSSRGRGLGATFAIELPTEPQAEAQATAATRP